MLELKNISKEYTTGAETVHALRGVDLAFRESEFVSILGPSGCGKTTMLNILGGLDQYTSGDLIIDGISTKEYKDADWDAYRNDTIGFVFQSYNLISHQTVLSNVELALTLSGVSASERRRRAVAALEQVGLGDQINKKPAQMSGGQVQRVAIARALINDPDIILADEPTGALDTETSTQVMSILKGISSDRLVIMVTHNPDLAEMYSTRIVRLSDGQVISDSDPFIPGDYDVKEGTSIEPDPKNEAVGKFAGKIAGKAIGRSAGEVLAGPAGGFVGGQVGKTIGGQLGEASADHITMDRREKKSGRARGRRNKSMSMGTALHLSLNNLMTKKARTLLTAFAGSIGIIGIALILSVSNGFQKYIDKLEEDTLSSYPLTIQSETADMASMITAFAASEAEEDEIRTDNKIREQQVMSEMLGSIGSNDLTAFKKYLDTNMGDIGVWFNDYEYTYGISPTIYSLDMKYGPLRVSPGSIMQSYMNSMQTAMVAYANTDVFFQMIGNQDLLKSQYKVLAGKWPENYDELLLVLQDPDQLNDYIVYTLGLRDPQELKDMISEVMKGNEVEVNNKPLEWTYDDFIGKEFALVNACDLYRRNAEYGVWEDMSDDDAFMKDLIKNSEKIKITGIVCPVEKSGANAMSMGIGYLPSLTQHMIDYAAESDIVKIQKADKNTDVFSGKTFEDIRNKTDEGLGFDDMITIDQDKLKKSLGGDIDPKAIQKAIEKNAKEALSEADPTGIIKKVMETTGENCGNMVKDILAQTPDEQGMIKFNEDVITKALGDNLDTGKHKAIVNKLLKDYQTLLKKKAEEMAAAKAEGAAEAPDAEQIAEQMGMTVEDLEKMAEGMGMTLEDLISQYAGSTEESDPDSFPVMQVAGELQQITPEYMSQESVTSFVTAYAEGIALKKTAQNVPEALVNVAQSVGSQFKVDPSGIADAFQMKMSEEELTRLITAYMSGNEDSSYEANMRKLGYANVRNPVAMSFYLKDFDSKEAFLDYIDSYNKDMQDSGKEDLVISYTDITGVMMKSVKTITNAVSYVLIAFVAISLIVSSIMIGVITYISVLERTKEIGILRAIGASKKDISRIFNAETIIVGLCAGIIGIAASLLLLIPINKILIGLTGIQSLRAILPPAGGVILILISIFLTFIAGLIPSGMAARKDPVVALRTE